VRCRKKEQVEESCYDLSVARMRKCFERYDKVVVSFSGGKDSTACLQIALDVAREQERLPLEVISFDEEAIPPDTVDYMQRVADMPEVDFRWYCVPIQHRNACSEKQPYWYPWHPDDKEKWVRDLPATAITEIPGFKHGMGIPECIPLIYGPEHGTVAMVLGIRCQESMTRYRSIAAKPAHIKDDAFLTSHPTSKHIVKACPIYDWNTEDVWRAPSVMGWDYNTAYDALERAGVTRHLQRCAPPFGEQPIRGLSNFKVCWPELWGKMVDRVPGAATAARYANTHLYACGISDEDLPSGHTWRSYTFDLAKRLSGESKKEVCEAVEQLIKAHQKLSKDPIPDEKPHDRTGYCWKDICVVARVGGNKFGRQTQKINKKAILHRIKMGVPYAAD